MLLLCMVGESGGEGACTSLQNTAVISFFFFAVCRLADMCTSKRGTERVSVWEGNEEREREKEGERKGDVQKGGA